MASPPPEKQPSTAEVFGLCVGKFTALVLWCM